MRGNPFVIGFTGALGVLIAYAGFLAIRNAASILVLVLAALFFAIGLNPAVVRLQQLGLRRGLAVAVVALALVVLLCGGLFALLPPVFAQSGAFIDQLPGYLEQLRRTRVVTDLVERYDVLERIQSAVNAQTVRQVLNQVIGGATAVFGTIFSGLTVLVLTIYFLGVFDKLHDLAYALVPASRRDRARQLGDQILAKFGAYLLGALVIAVLAGASTLVFALVAGLAYPFALAVVVAVCDLIPQIGATLGAVIVSLVAFVTSAPTGLACVVFFLIYQQVENYLIYPKVMRRSLRVNDAAALVAALLGVALLGLIGALVAVPVVAAVQLILKEIVLPRQDAR